MEQKGSTVSIHINGVEMTYSYNFERMPVVGEYIWIDNHVNSGLYKIHTLVHTATLTDDQDAWVQVDPVDTGSQYADKNSRSVIDILNKKFGTKLAK
jgi:hypothetical protein